MAEKQFMEGQGPVPPPYSEPSAPMQAPPMHQPPMHQQPPMMQQPVYNYNAAPGGQPMTAYGNPAAPPGYQGVSVQPLPGQYGVPMAPGTTIVVTTGPQNSRLPANCICPKCQQSVMTQVDYENGTSAWVLFGIICLLGGWVFCLCLIPFCINDLKDAKHICPNCKHHIATCQRM